MRGLPRATSQSWRRLSTSRDAPSASIFPSCNQIEPDVDHCLLPKTERGNFEQSPLLGDDICGCVCNVPGWLEKHPVGLTRGVILLTSSYSTVFLAHKRSTPSLKDLFFLFCNGRRPCSAHESPPDMRCIYELIGMLGQRR